MKHFGFLYHYIRIEYAFIYVVHAHILTLTTFGMYNE